MKKSSSSQQSPKLVEEAFCLQGSITIGMDLGDKHSCYCVLNGQGLTLPLEYVSLNRPVLRI